MQEPVSSAGPSSDALRAGLLDYSQAPGKYQIGLRQPQLLFANVRDILQIAIGREGHVNDAEEAVFLRDAARFFVRTALLFPGADHYALFGVERTVDNADLKDRYRLMMRLLHPDFSGPTVGLWPVDSAVRVNLAYDTLSSIVQRRLYDESLVITGHGVNASKGSEARRPRPAPARSDAATRQSHYQILAVICALAGVGLVALIVAATGSPESVHLVQRARVQMEPQAASKETPALPLAATVSRLQEAIAQLSPPTAPALSTTRRSEPPIARPTEPAAKQREAAITQPVASGRVPSQIGQSPPGPPESSPVAIATPSPAELKPEVMLAAAPAPIAAPLPPTVPAVIAAVAPTVPAPQPPKAPPRSGPTLQEAQPLLSHLLQVMESGRGDRILNLLEAEARNKPAAQALSRQYDTIVDGARPVRVSHVELKAEPADGRLLVVGYFRVIAGEQPIGFLGKKMVLRAEFASREGNVVITGLSGGPVN